MICNTTSRCTELCDELLKVISEGRLLSKQAQRLRGECSSPRPSYSAELGRCLRVLADFTEGRRSMLTEKDKFFLHVFHNLLANNIPREVGACVLTMWLSSPTLATRCCCGKWEDPLLLFGSGCKPFWVRKRRSKSFRSRNSGGTPLCKLWHGLFGNRRVVLFVDNEGTKFSLLKGFLTTLVSMQWPKSCKVGMSTAYNNVDCACAIKKQHCRSAIKRHN